MESETLSDKKPMRCEICGKAYTDVESFTAHLSDHPKENAIPSSFECQSTFAIANNLSVATSHSQENICDGNRKPHKCSNCSSGFEKQFELQNHSLMCPVNANIVNEEGISEKGTSAELRLEEDPVIPFVVPVEVLIQEEPEQQLQVHDELVVDPLKLKRKIVRVPCQICNATFMAQHHLDDHFLKYHSRQQFDKPLYECRKCKLVFGCLGDLKDHSVVTGHGNRPYKCNICSRKAHSMLGLTTHRRNAHQLEDMKCEKCGNIFEDGKKFESHCKRANQVEMKNSFTCVICGEGFVTEERLFRHQSYHWNRKLDFLTDIDRVYPNFCELPRKVRPPEIIKNHPCPCCPKTFRKTTSVMNHIRKSHKMRVKTHTAKLAKNKVKQKMKFHNKNSTPKTNPKSQLNKNALNEETEPQGASFEDQLESSSNNISYDNTKYEYVDIKCEIKQEWDEIIQ